MNIKHLRKFKNTETLYVIPTQNIDLWMKDNIKESTLLSQSFYWFSGKDLNDYLYLSAFVEEHLYVAFYTPNAPPKIKGQYLSELIDQTMQKEDQQKLLLEMTAIFKR